MKQQRLIEPFDPARKIPQLANNRVCQFLLTFSVIGFLGNRVPCLAAEASGPVSAESAAVGETLLATAQRLLDHPAARRDDPGYSRELIETARALGRLGELETSLALFVVALEQQLAKPTEHDEQTIISLRLAIASASWQLGKHQVVIEEAGKILLASQDDLDMTRGVAVHQLLIRSLIQTGQLELAIEQLHLLAERSPKANSIALEQALAIGGIALRSERTAIAKTAFELYLTLAPEGERAGDASLGAAWAATMGAESPAQAETRIANFIGQFPQHSDVPHAMAAHARLLESLGEPARAEQVRIALLKAHPANEAVPAMLEDFARSATGPWPEPLREAWLARLDRCSEADADSAISSALWPRIFVAAFADTDNRLWQAAVQALLAADREGTLTFELLQTVSNSEPHIAEHLAVDLLARLLSGPDTNLSTKTSGPSPRGSEAIGTPMGCDAACRWAGLTERWSLLALVADQLEPPTVDTTPARGLVIDRLLAESLMQTRRAHDAARWWEAIVEIHRCQDFETTLRAAETAVAYGTIDAAKRYLAKAKDAASDRDFEISLVQILEAELAVRGARMDEARAILERLAREPATSAELKPRTQWMIGETYFLQERYTEAIDAYRRVDAIDPRSDWAVAAMLQSGKAFEKLGLHRDAATCYTALLTRFPTSPHVEQARLRLAQIGSPATTRR